MSLPQRFSYQIAPTRVAVILLSSCLSLAILIHLTLKYAQPTETGQGYVVDWAVVLCLACLLFVSCLIVAFLVIVVLNNVGKRAVILTEDALITPRDSLSKAVVTVPYKQLNSVEKLLRPQHSILVNHQEGWLLIPKFMLPHETDFETIYTYLKTKTA